MVILRADADRLLPAFLYSAVRSRQFRSQIKTLTSGAAQPQLPIRDIKLIKIPLPSLPAQRRVASIIGAYDDLLQVNRRRIALLEEMARRLFEEWFVRFRFPGHEGARMVNTPEGLVPECWRQATLSAVAEFKTGFPFKSGTFAPEGKHRIVTIRNVQDGAFNPSCDSAVEELPEKLPAHCLLSDGDVLMSLTGNVGRVCIVYDGPFLLNQRVAALAPVGASGKMFLYSVFRQPGMRRKLELASNGVARQNLSPIIASKLHYLMPPSELIGRFRNVADPLFDQIVNLLRMSNRLGTSRDLLLPRLISGELSVFGAESELEAAE